MEYIEVIKRPKTPVEKVISALVSIVCCIVVALCGIVVISTLNCKMNNVVSSVAGYSAVTIAPTGSMTDSGFNAWDVVLVKKVNVRALKGDQVDENGKVLVRGDIIAYYRYFSTSNSAKINNLPVYTIDMALAETENYDLSTAEFFGAQNDTIYSATKTNCAMVFHHIKEVREDKETGKLYFKTYGSSNKNYYGDIVEDSYWISEDVIVGKYYEDGNPLILSVFKLFASQAGIIVLVCIPLIVMLFFVFLDVMRNLSLAGLESSVLNGKLSLSDPVCVANHIGFRMSKNTKFRVLAQLTPQERIESVTYLWQSPKDVQHMKKYYIKQKLLMHYDEERTTLKAEYAPILSGKGKKVELAQREYYKKLKDIEKREEATVKKLKEISKRANIEKMNEGYNELDAKHPLKYAKIKLNKGETLHIGPHKSKEAKKIVQEIERHSVPTHLDDNLANKDINEAVDVFKNLPKNGNRKTPKI